MTLREGWDTRPLGECLAIPAGYGANAPSIDYSPSLPRYLRITDIGDEGQIIDENKRSISPEDANGCFLEDGDVVFARTGATVGKTYLHRKSRDPIAFAGYLIRFRVDRELLNPDFLFQYCQSPAYWAWVALMSRAGAQPNINAGEYSSLRLPLPPVTEQNAIVAVLSAWDRGIRQLSDLIAAKLRFKQGLMQQLLTGKRRFKEFRDDWKSMRIGDVAEVRFSGIDKKTLDGETPVRLCNYLDVYRNEMIRDDMVFMNGSATSREIESLSLRKHDVLITKDSETPDDIAKAAYVVGDLDNVVLGYHLGLLRPYETVFGPYLSRLVMSPIMRYRFTRIANGATRYGLPLAATKRINIQVPSSIDEQQKIANVADLADHEIDLLRKELDALKTQKKGLMQKLLTGQVRVKLPKGGG